MSSAGTPARRTSWPAMVARPSSAELCGGSGRAARSWSAAPVLAGGNDAAGQDESRGRVLQLQRDLAGEAVAAQGVDGDRHGRAAAGVDAGGHHAQCEIGLRAG